MRKLCVDMDVGNGKTVTITGQDAKHLANVMRFSPGKRFELCDGKGRDFMAEIRTISSSIVVFDVLEEISSCSESPAYIIFCQGMLKEKKMDMLVRHLTELGISEWIPFIAERSVPKLKPERMKSRMQRWIKIAKEALNQCGRSVVPSIGRPVQFDELIRLYGKNIKDNTKYRKIIFFEKALRPIDDIRDQIECDYFGERKRNAGSYKIVVLIGPEGGFTDNEISAAQDNGFKIYSLGPRILRAETASIASCTLLQNIFGDLGRKST